MDGAMMRNVRWAWVGFTACLLLMTPYLLGPPGRRVAQDNAGATKHAGADAIHAPHVGGSLTERARATPSQGTSSNRRDTIATAHAASHAGSATPLAASQGAMGSMAAVRRGRLRAMWKDFGRAATASTAGREMPAVRDANGLISDEIVHNARASWKQFVATMPAYPSLTMTAESGANTGDPTGGGALDGDGNTTLFAGRGIVMAGGGYQLDWVYATASLLRSYGCVLPIELWVSSGRGEMPDHAAVRNLTTLGVTVGDVDAIANVFPAMGAQLNPLDAQTKPYIIKQVALVSAACRVCLLLDADNTPLRDPAYLLEDPRFLDTGLLLWPDFWHMRAGPASIRRIFQLGQGWGNLPDMRTVESGQIVVDKRRAWATLMLSTYMQLHTEFFDNQMRELHHLGGGGDKQTFLIACLATNSSCHMVQHAVASAGAVIGGRYCGRGMVQFDPDGKMLFVHSNMDKQKFSEAVRASSQWSEDLRRNTFVRIPHVEGSGSVGFNHVEECGGGKWVVTVQFGYKEQMLTDAAGFDLEKARYRLMKAWVMQHG